MFEVFGDMQAGRYVHAMPQNAIKALAGSKHVKFQHENLSGIKGWYVIVETVFNHSLCFVYNILVVYKYSSTDWLFFLEIHLNMNWWISLIAYVSLK